MFTPFPFSSYLCLLLFILFHFCSSNQNLEKVACLESEREALLLFKHGLIDESNRLSSWDVENIDCCKWVGILCDNSTGHVHQIHLPGLDGHCRNFFITTKELEEDAKQRLKGDISPSLLDLKQLEHLDLSCNDFGMNQVPKFIGSLENLRYLNLSSSNFGGIIPPQLGNLSNLHILCLGSFHYVFESTTIANVQWLSSLRMLRHLDMSDVDLSKATDWVQVMQTLPSLVELHLSHCELSYIHPYIPSLNLTTISLLDISYNNFNSSLPQWIFSITSLVSLDLTWCHFHDLLSPSIYSFRNLTSLKLLHVAENDFMSSSSVLKELSGSNLISVYASNCGVSSSRLDSLQNLTSLLSLDLSRNQLTSRLHKSLGDLCALRVIDLSNNNFESISLTYLLKSFLECKSSSLESLSLFRNNIVGVIPNSIGQLYRLRILDLRMNQISGHISYSIGQLSLLKTLDLSNNQFDGNLPDSLGQLSMLVYLDFRHNLLTGIVTEAHFANLVSLKFLDGSGNNLTLKLQVQNWIPPFQLQILYLKSWVLGPHFPLWLQTQKMLTDLDIGNTHISSPMPMSFVSSFANLSSLNISHNHMQGTIKLLGLPKTLDVLDLSSNEFSGSLHDLLCSSSVNPTQALYLGNNLFSGVIPECWEKWPSLVVLNMENNNLSGGIPITLGSIQSLQFLNIRGNKISGNLPSSMMNLTRLRILQLGRNELVGRIPSWIGTKFTSLRILNLRRNEFNDTIPHELCYLVYVHILDLALNNLSGNIPRCFNNFSVLSGLESQFSITFGFGSSILGDSLVIRGKEDIYSTILGLVMLLDLSSNNLGGHIPIELTSLLELKSLNLSRNQLVGPIPESIGDMTELISFDLSLNKLSGKLPMSLSKLNFLSSFNVSYNNLTGRIPTSTQLQSLNESSFFGNKLCGVPLIKNDDCVPFQLVPKDKTQVPNDDDVDDDEHDWGFIISIVSGFGIGFWIIVGPMIVNRSWRIAYLGFLNKVRHIVYKVSCLQ